MRRYRRHSLILLAALASLLAVLPIAASARSAPPKPAHSARAAGRSVVLTTHVAAPGVYRVSVTITSRASRRHTVRLLIGSIRRSTDAGGRHKRTHLSVALRVSGRTVTVRALSRLARPILRITVQRTQPAPVKAGASKPASAPASVPSTATATTPLATAATGASAAGTPPPAAPPPPAGTTVPVGSGSLFLPAGFAPVAGYATLAKDYEFAGGALPSDWTTGNANYGFQATFYQPSQVSMTGSSVSLTATPASGGSYPYQSGWISTAGRFTLTHGEIDFRAKMPAGQGLWSGLWAVNGANPSGELDVAEMLLANTHIVNASLHDWQNGGYVWGETQYTIMGADASQDFHDYQVIWQPGMLTWAVDGVAYAQYTKAQATAAGQAWPYDNDPGVYLIANLAVGAASEWGGAPTAATPFPATMQVQSVRVWQ